MNASVKEMIAYRRKVLHHARALLEVHPDLVDDYERAKQVVRVFRTPAFYEISTQCNMACEGCYYFDYDRHPVEHDLPLDQWISFFKAEAERGVTMAYFLGAEPALRQDRLHAAVPHFKYGNLGTNGTILIDRDIPFRIAISAWGADKTDLKVRKKSPLRQAVKMYEGDPRVNILYTIARWNIDDIRPVVDICRDAGLQLTFSLYSPTDTFLMRRNLNTTGNEPGLKKARLLEDPCFTEDDLTRICDLLGGLLEDYPETVVYSQAYNRWSTRPGPLYRINPETGIAEDCHSRIVPPMRYYTTGLKPAEIKCCTPALDCSQCRIYSGGWSSKFDPCLSDVETVEAFKDWMDMVDTVGKIFLYEKSVETKQPLKQRP